MGAAFGLNANLLFSTLKNKVKRLTEELKKKSDFAEELESMVRLSNAGRTPLSTPSALQDHSQLYVLRNISVFLLFSDQ